MQAAPVAGAIGGAPGGEPPAPTHPVALFCHFIFKVVALVFYILCESINKGQFVSNFVICIVLLAMDFWVVKNVTGRLLVGLRWWNDASAADGGAAWRFESLGEGQRAVNPHERRVFWGVLVAAPALWALSALSAFLGLDWAYLLIPVIGVVLSSSNLFGYYQCSKEAKRQLQSMGTNLISAAMQNRLQAAFGRV